MFLRFILFEFVQRLERDRRIEERAVEASVAECRELVTELVGC